MLNRQWSFWPFSMRFGSFRAHFGPGMSLKKSEIGKNDADLKDARWKMLEEKWSFWPFLMRFGWFRAHFRPRKSLKKVQIGKTKKTKMKRTEECRKKKSDFDYFRCVLGSLGPGILGKCRLRCRGASRCVWWWWWGGKGGRRKSFQVLAQPLVYIYIYIYIYI